MSWSYNAQNIEGSDAAGELAKARAAYEANIQDFALSGYAEDQAKELEAAAVSIIESGVVGKADGYRFNVTLSGHGNPNHQPHPSWANDMVTISISQSTQAA